MELFSTLNFISVLLICIVSLIIFLNYSEHFSKPKKNNKYHWEPSSVLIFIVIGIVLLISLTFLFLDVVKNPNTLYAFRNLQEWEKIPILKRKTFKVLNIIDFNKLNESEVFWNTSSIDTTIVDEIAKQHRFDEVFVEGSLSDSDRKTLEQIVKTSEKIYTKT